jgi:toxin FitB
MIVLDTNVVSELMREHPHAKVDAWVRRRPREEFAITSVTVAEVLYGIRLLPEGRRRRELEQGWEAFQTRGLRRAVLPFDVPAADAYSQLVVARRREGRPMDTLDAMIAAIARVHGAAVATRNSTDFSGCEVELLDPWRDET